MRRLSISRLATALLIGHAVALLADDTAATRREQRLQQMRGQVEALKLKVEQRPGDRQPRLARDPLLRFDDPTRDFYDGALWMWCDRGRPHVLVSTERYEKFWSYEWISLTAEPFSIDTSNGWIWQPTDPPFVEQTIKDAAVGETPAIRRRQARDLSRRFETAEYLGEVKARTVLRLSPRPIHEYEDGELLHGSMFVFANGINPEVLLLLEARSTAGKQYWQFAFAPLSSARVEAKLGIQVVWEAAAQEKPQAQRPYAYSQVPIEVDE